MTWEPSESRNPRLDAGQQDVKLTDWPGHGRPIISQADRWPPSGIPGNPQPPALDFSRSPRRALTPMANTHYARCRRCRQAELRCIRIVQLVNQRTI
jgi:hypothetical protein